MTTPYRKVLVIGATSGIGWALAERFVQSGSQVIVSGRRERLLEDFVQEHSRGQAFAAPFDILKTDEIDAFAKSLVKQHPDLDCVVLNSGVQIPTNFAEPASLNLDAMRLELDSNYYAYLALLKAFVPHLQEIAKAHKPAGLVFTSSGLALVPHLSTPTYSATKAALHQLLLAVRLQLKSSGIKVVEIFPPAVQTELHDYMGKEAGRSFGMPLKDFTDETWQGLVEGRDEIYVGPVKHMYEHFEKARGPCMEAFLSRK